MIRLRHGLLLVLAALVVTGPAAATVLTRSPSTAPTLQPGVPLTIPMRVQDRDAEGYLWLRLPYVLHSGDSVQLAISNDTSGTGQLCVVPPVDDFGAANAIKSCSWGERVRAAGKDRQVLRYAGATGQPLLSLFTRDTGYTGTMTFTVEKATIRLHLGWTPRSRVSRSVDLSAVVRYGDNQPAADGTVVALAWKPLRASRRAWKAFGSGRTAGGNVRLRGRLPAATRGTRISLRACAGAFCAPVLTVTVR